MVVNNANRMIFKLHEQKVVKKIETILWALNISKNVSTYEVVSKWSFELVHTEHPYILASEVIYVTVENVTSSEFAPEIKMHTSMANLKKLKTFRKGNFQIVHTRLLANYGETGVGTPLCDEIVEFGSGSKRVGSPSNCDESGRDFNLVGRVLACGQGRGERCMGNYRVTNCKLMAN